MSVHHEIKYENLSPTSNIESEVPREQHKRDPPQNDVNIPKMERQNDVHVPKMTEHQNDVDIPVMTERQNDGNEIVVKNNDSYVPVLTKERVPNPAYSEVHGEVVRGPQPIRPAPRVPDSEEEQGETKIKSRIPKLNFRRAAEKIKKERRHSEDNKEHEIPTQRRSSIPKLKKIKIPPKDGPESEQDKTKATEAVQDLVYPETPAEDAFDRIYDEIIHTATNEADMNISKEIDSEELEHSFEEIIHDYEENKVQPIDVQQVKSKIPLVKQQSLPEERFAKKLERRLSHKDTINDKENNVKLDAVSASVNNDSVSKIQRKDQIKTGLKDINVAKQSKDSRSKEIEEHNRTKSPSVKSKTEEKVVAKNTDDIKIKIIDNKIETIKVVSPIFDKTPKTNKTEHKNDIDDLKITINNQSKPDNSVPYYMLRSEDKSIESNNVDENNANTEKSSSEKCDYEEGPDNVNTEIVIKDSLKDGKQADTESMTKIPTIKGKVSHIISRIDANDQTSYVPPKKEFPNDIPKKSSILSKISMFSEDNEVNNNKIDIKKADITESVIKITKPKDFTNTTTLAKKIRRDSVEKLKFTRAVSVPATYDPEDKVFVTPPNTPQTDDLEPKNFDVHTKNDGNNNLNSENYVTSYKETNKIVIEDYEKVKYIERDDIIESENVEAIFESEKDNEKITEVDNVETPINEGIYSPVEAFNDNLKAEEAINDNFDEDDLVFKGKVSRIISRIDSINETETAVKKDAAIEIPIKRSVSSRIAMFERQTPKDPEPRFKPKQEPKKPIIIDEILKTEPPKQNELQDNNAKVENKITDEKSINKKPHKEQNTDFKKGVISQEIAKTEVTITIVNNLETDVSIANKDDDLKANINTIEKEIPAKIESTKRSANQHKEPIGNKTDIAVNTVNNLETDDPIANKDKDSKDKFNTIEKETPVITGTTKLNESYSKEQHKEDTQSKGQETRQRTHRETFLLKPKDPPSLDERLRLLQSRNDGHGMKKAKSTAELDLGDAIKGKVRQMIVRMNSVEKIDVRRESNINIKERPRKRSVSEKIALFEKKLTVAEMEVSTPTSFSTTGTTFSTDPTTIPTDTTDIPTDSTTPEPKELTEEDYKEIKADLDNAREKYGNVNISAMMEFNNGEKMPVIALGTALMDPKLLRHIIGAAIDLGYRAIDTAYIYGNEADIGDVIRAKIADGTVKREELFIIGKLWSTFHRRDLVEPACRASLAALKVDYFDLYLVHNPMAFKEGGDALPMVNNELQYSDVDFVDTWKGMEDLVDKKLSKSIGISNFNSAQIAKLLSNARITPVMNQVECHPYLPQVHLDKFCSDRDIRMMCFGTLGSKGTPRILKGYSDAVIDDATIRVMAAASNVTTAQFLLKYQLQRGHAVVAKASSAAHLWNNLQVFGFELDPSQVRLLNSMNRNRRTYVFKGMGDTHKDYPFKVGY